MPTVRLTIDGMKCDGCAQRVEDGLSKAPGVTEAHADHEQGLAQAEVDTKDGDADALEAAVEDLGYEVTGVNAL